ncbi:thiopurine S-methyltransferase [Zhongshania sp.]|uniref:thiopurine S-methyltransferase n=1 Tax=Zhongshania sp. TaxID=1971902 RepID=UPI001B450950|nr:thiopurine S-methyltransferase [Zhongshania sp.]MBQ0794487.1 thiopurine S-methyltransferase [Zhongshania sp.]
MDAEFWHQRWGANEIGFHQEQGNPLLKAHFSKLNLAVGSRVFIPLCGKTKDIAWLLAQGVHVIGAELSELAIEALFADLGLRPDVTELGKLRRYRAPYIDIFVGDIFELSAELVGEVDAIYDRAALVALPESMRRSYTVLLTEICRAAPQLIICFEYNQDLQEGPPFSIGEAELRDHYEAVYALQCLDRVKLDGGLKGGAAANEVVWLLNKTEV